MASPESPSLTAAYMGVDVGTGSVRVGLVSEDGRLMEPQTEEGHNSQIIPFYLRRSRQV